MWSAPSSHSAIAGAGGARQQQSACRHRRQAGDHHRPRAALPDQAPGRVRGTGDGRDVPGRYSRPTDSGESDSTTVPNCRTMPSPAIRKFSVEPGRGHLNDALRNSARSRAGSDAACMKHEEHGGAGADHQRHPCLGPMPFCAAARPRTRARRVAPIRATPTTSRRRPCWTGDSGTYRAVNHSDTRHSRGAIRNRNRQPTAAPPPSP